MTSFPVSGGSEGGGGTVVAMVSASASGFQGLGCLGPLVRVYPAAKPGGGALRAGYRGGVIPPRQVPFVGGDGFPFGSAPWAQWGEGRADKVIYLHLSTSCNGWHFHLSLKLHHLAVEPPPTPPTCKIKGLGQRGLEQTCWTRGSRKENRLSRWELLFQSSGGGVWERGAAKSLLDAN